MGAFEDSLLDRLLQAYNLAKSCEPHQMSPLDSLEALTGPASTSSTNHNPPTDPEQLWEALQLQNGPMLKFLRKSVDTLLDMDDIQDEEGGDDEDEDEEEETAANSSQEEEGERDEEEDNSSSSEMDEEEVEEQVNNSDDNDSDSLVNDDNDDIDNPTKSSNSSTGTTIALLDRFRRKEKTAVDDNFFSVREMEAFAQQAETWDGRQAEREYKQEESDSEDGGDGSGGKDILKRDFDLGLGFFDQDPDMDGGDDDDDDDEDIMNMDDDFENSNDIMYEDFFGPRDAVLQDQQKHYPSRRDRVNNNKSSQRENLELENDDDGYYDMPNDDSTNSSADKADEDEDAMNEDGSSVDNDSSSNPLASQSNSSNKTKNLFDDDDTSPSGEQQELSTFEKQQQKLSKAISALEEDAVAAKPWTLKGEAQAKDRPQNALLEEDLEVDYAAKPVPVITEETTQTLEEIIKARILDSLFDDVVRVAPREGTAFDPNRRIELDGTKSSVGLADVYESEYMRNQQQQAGGGSGVATEKDSKLQAVHEEIESLFKNLCLQLDALSNWHYTPAPPTAEITVLPTSNNNTTPAIAMEEALPAAVSDASLLAPRDVYDGKIAKSAAEMTTADKTRLRVAARKRVGKDKADKEAVLAAKEAARAVKMGGVAALDRTKSAAGTKSAMKTLAGMSNVTFVNEGATMGRLIAGSGIGNKGRGGKNKKGGGKSGGGGGEASVVSNDASKRSKSSSSVTANPNMMRL